MQAAAGAERRWLIEGGDSSLIPRLLEREASAPPCAAPVT